MSIQISNDTLKSFNFKLKTDTKFGIGISKNIPNILANLGLGTCCIVIDSGVMKNNSLIRDLLSNLNTSVEVAIVFENKMSEPDYDYLDLCKSDLSSLKFNNLIAIGGGSTIDLAKGIAILMTNPGKAISFRGWDLAKNPALPIIAIPTTAGTGSEVTPNAVFIAKNEKRKLGINTDYIRPYLAILDPLLTLSCPESVTVSSGMDALTHTLESFVAKNATPVSKMFSREAFTLIFNNLPRVLNDKSNVDLRSNLLLGSYLAGIALMNSGAGPAGALSYVLGVHYSVPHGLAGAVFLPQVINLNVKKGCTSYLPLYDLIDGADHNIDEHEKSVRFVQEFDTLCKRMSIPTSLKKFDVAQNNLNFLIKESFWLRAAIEQNPIPYGEDEVQQIWESLM